MTASYGSCMRALLLRPILPKSLETVTDVVESGLPWKAVEYGDWGETRIKNSDIDVVQRYWNGRTVVPFQEFPFDRVGIGLAFFHGIFKNTTVKHNLSWGYNS